MKNLTKIFLVVAMLAVSFACTTDVTEDLGVAVDGQTKIVLSLEESRTQLGEKAGETYPLYWSAGDKISVNGVESNAAVIGGNGSVATFAFSGTLATPYCIAYPAANAGEVVFAAQQSYVEGTFSNGASTMYGYSENGEGIALNHLTGVLKVGVVGLKKLVLAQVSTADRAAIAGPFAIDFTTGELTATAASKEVIEYSFGEGVQLSSEATYLHLAVPAGEYNELYVTLYDADGGVMYATVKAGDSKPLAVGKVREFSNNIIYAPTANVYVIRDKETLKGFAAAVNAAGSAYTNDALMVADVDMTGEEWTSLNWKSASKETDGSLSLATFHGNGYAIKGLTAPLFDTLTANVKGLHLRDVNINETARADVGSLARWFKAANFAADPTKATAADIAKPTVSHCSTTGKITVDCKEYLYDKTRPLSAYGPFSSGGLLAVCLSGNIEDCVNEIDIDVKQVVASSNTTELHPWVGGIVGYIESINTSVYLPETCSNLRRLTNKGDISFNDPFTGFTVSAYSKLKAIVGGILGANATKAYDCEMVDLKNYGNITLTGSLGHDTMVGGVIGRPAAANVKNVYNYGKLSMDGGDARLLYIGGCAGYTSGTIQNNYDNLQNYGEVSIKNINVYALCVGGVFGSALSNSSYAETNVISNSANNAPVTVENVNQISGHTAGAYFRVGGFAAWIQHTMDKCYNNKEGVVNVKNCTIFNAEKAYNALCIGGLVGYKTVHYTNNCTNHADVNVLDSKTITADDTFTNAGYVRLNVAGCFGWKTDKTGDNCVNNGNVNISGKYVGRLVVGGICGTSSTTITLVWTNLVNNGNINIMDGTTANHVSSIAGIFGNTQSGVENATNNGDVYIGKDFTACNECHFASMVAYVAKTESNFKNLTNNGNLTLAHLIYTAPTYIGGVFGYAFENADKTSYPGVFGVYQHGKTNVTVSRPARTQWKDDLTSGGTICNGGIGGFLGGLLDDAIVYEGADYTFHSKSSANFTAKNATSADKGNVQWGDIAYGMKDYPTNCVNHGNFTLTGTVGGTLYTGMFGGPYNYSRKNCVNYGTQTIDATIKVNCFPSHGCYDANANATFVNCHNHGDIVFGPNCKISQQLRTGMFFSKLETSGKYSICDGCSNSGNYIIKKGASFGTETRIGMAVGCHVKGTFLVRNGFTNSGNIVFSGACIRKLAEKPLCLGGVIGNSAYNGTGDANSAFYTTASATTVGAISYPAGSWTGDIVNSGNITYDGTCTTGVAIGGIIGDLVSTHTTAAVPSGAKYIVTGDITASGTFATSIVETEGAEAKTCWNGIGGIYGHSNLSNVVVEDAEVYTTLAANSYPNVGLLFGFERNTNVYGKNCKVGGTISEWNVEDEEYITKPITGENFFKYIYSAAIEKSVAEGDGCSVLESKPTIQ